MRARRALLVQRLALVAVVLGCGDRELPAGEIEGGARPAAAIAEAARIQGAAAGAVHADAAPERRILFGDLHVHTTWSIDAFLASLPFFGGEGAHPLADACDYARHCAALDFFSINDHAEAMTPARWRATKDSIRACNERAGDPANPDLVAYVGWEWTQVDPWVAENHYGHKNVIFPGLAEDELPTRPITALPHDVMRRMQYGWLVEGLQPVLAGTGLGRYADFLWWIEQLAELPNCERGVPVRELPEACRENAPTPGELFEKLDQWGLETLVIPHGTAWGIHTPPRTDWRKQLTAAQDDPEKQRLIEVFSGHGNSEVWRPWSAAPLDASGAPFCPAPTADFLPCCWRAGEIMRERCGDLPGAECDARVEEARRLALEAGVSPHWIFPDTTTEDWLDCDQCRDCFKPAFALRPRHGAQYALSISNPAEAGEDGRPRRFRWGFLSSSDNHTARPGTGFKQMHRTDVTDMRGVTSAWRDRALDRFVAGTPEDPRRAQAVPVEPMGFRKLLDTERNASFLHPGGLVAVHAAGRDRRSIWDALVRREVYGTSGPRILLWFDLVQGETRVPMGGEVRLAEAPRFEVRAVGARVQRPGCPDESANGLSPERLEHLCRSECHHPGDARHRIEAIEIVRIRPQTRADEPVGDRIEDPWRRFDCPPHPAGCVATFADDEYPGSGRDAVYYARALQEPTPAINGANLRTEFDAEGNPVRVTPCYGGYQTPEDDECLAPVRERAWSSPIFVDRP